MRPTPASELEAPDARLITLVIEAGCPVGRTDRCARLIEQALLECLKVYKANPKAKAPNKRRVFQKIQKLRKAYGNLIGDKDGRMALALIPGWSVVSVKSRIADLDLALRNVERIMRKRLGTPEGSRTSPGYDWFLMRLWSLAKICGFEWTAKKNRKTGKAEGTFVQLVRGIESKLSLPDGFIPASDATLLKGIGRAKARMS